MEFFKYVAAGNDFIVLDRRQNPQEDYGILAKKLCNRNFGIGADGLLVCETSKVGDIKMVYYNSDGSQGEICGNGIRSFVKFVYDEEIVRKREMEIETLAGVKLARVEGLNHRAEKIEVDMGYPQFKPEEIPTLTDKPMNFSLEILARTYDCSAIRMGVPHLVIFVEDIGDIDIDLVGEKIENHPLFPEKINVNFVEIIDRKRIKDYTWERGAGRTLGCGTGSCAAVVIGNKRNLLDREVEIETEGGFLDVVIGEEGNVLMKGGATYIAKGKCFI